jgi:hypothetical protein
MSLPPRAEFPGAVRQRMARGDQREEIFQDDRKNTYRGDLDHGQTGDGPLTSTTRASIGPSQIVLVLVLVLVIDLWSGLDFGGQVLD